MSRGPEYGEGEEEKEEMMFCVQIFLIQLSQPQAKVTG